MNKGIKRFLAAAACITVIGHTGNFAFSETAVINERTWSANGNTGIVKDPTPFTGKDYTWNNSETSANVNLQTGGTLVINNYTDENTNGQISASGGNLNLNSGTLTINSGSSILNNVTTNISSGSTLSVAGGNVNLNSGDTFDGNLNVSDGNTSLNNVTANGSINLTGGNTTLNNVSSGGTFNQTDGTTTVIGNNFTLDTTEDIISGGIFNIGNGTSSQVNLSGGSINQNASVNINQNANLNISGGNAQFDNSDTWNGNINLTDGNLELSGINKNASGTLTQTGGSATITGDTFYLNNTNDTISGGNLTIGSDTGDGELIASSGTMGKDASVNITENGTLEVSGANVTIDKNDSWNGIVGVTNGNLTIDSTSKNSSGIFVQTNGTTTITGNEFSLNNSSDTIEGGQLNIGTETQSGTLNIDKGNISEDVLVYVADSSTIDITSGEFTFDSQDTWGGAVNLSGTGTLNINNTQKTGTLTQNDGTLNISGKNFDLNNEDDLVEGGTLNVGDGTTASKLNVSSGTITTDSTVNLNDKSSIDIKGGSVTIDSDDTWSGKVNISNGNLNISGANKTGTITQTGGVTTVTGKTFDLIDSNDLIDGGNLNIGNGITSSGMSVSQGAISKDTSVNITTNSTLNVNGGNVSLGDKTIWGGNVNITDGKLNIDNTKKNFDGTFNQSGGTTIVTGSGFDLDNSADIISGGTLHVGDKVSQTDMSVTQGYIDSNAIVNINRNGTLNVSGGDVILDQSDAWQGTINVVDGHLNLNNINKNTEGKFTQTGGTTTITGDNLNLNNAEDNISGGTLNIGNGSDTSSLKVSQGTIGKDATVNLNTGSKIDISGGSVTIDNGDSWNGDINVSGGNFNVDNFSNKNGILTQTNGTTTVTGSGFDLNNTGDKFSGGTLNVGNGTTKTDMKVSQGTIDYNTQVNIHANSELNVTGGTVNLSNAYKNENGVFSQSDGTTTITGNNFALNNANDNIAGGTFNIGNGSTVTELNISQGTIQQEAVTNINSNAKLNINGGNVNLDSTDTWKGSVNVSGGSLALVGVTKNQSGVLTQTGGVTTVTGDTFDLNNSGDKISGGIFNIGADGDNSTISVSKGSIEKGASTNIAEGSSLNIKGGNVVLDGETDNFNGNVNLSSGNLTLDGMNKNNTGILTQTGGTATVIGTGTKLNNENDTISGGKLNIGSDTTAGELDVEKGSITSDASVHIKKGSSLNIKGGTTTLDGSNDKWEGGVNVSDGALNLSNINKTTTADAKFNQTGGTTNIDNNSKLTLNTSDSKISGGTVNITNSSELDINNSSNNSSAINSTGGKFSIRKGSKYSVTEGTIDQDSKVTVDEDGTLEVNGDDVNITLDGKNDKFAGHGKVTNGTLNLTNGISKTTTANGTFNQTGGVTNISQDSKLTLNDADSKISSGEINVDSTSELMVNNGQKHSSKLNVSGGHFGIKGKSTYSTTGGTVDSDANVEIESGSRLTLNGDDANVTLDGKNDKWTGSLKVDRGNLYISDDLTKVTDENGNYIQTGGNMTMSGSKIALADKNSLISGGKVNLTENSTLTVTQEGGSAITGGNVIIDDTSVLNYLAQKGLVQITDGNQINIDTSGLIDMANNVRTNNVINNLTINNGEYGDGQANFAIDVYARSSKDAQTDTFAANSIQVAAKDSTGTIHISDFNLGGDLFGYDAPIEKNIRLGKIFKSDDIGKEVNFTATDKEIFTPIGYYRLNPSAANDGNYSLDLTRFNPQVFRGQVATAASYMNQLVVNDTLFNRAQIRRYGASYDQMFKNKTAILDGTASFERTLKEGQLWTEVFGNFETLKMNNGLDKVRNNSWGFIVGGDFGLKELRNGWTYMPSAYIAYNGGRQTFSHVGMYENGAQIGFMNSWMKGRFIETALAYVGLYGTSMDIAGHSEDAFNYFFGFASKSAYDWEIGRNFKIQPSVTMAYNMFGQQNWHSDYGQMGMSSGFLNGFNIAPGVNFIYQRESWSMYATIAYAWNFFAGVDGRAGNVDLPSIKMAQGYLQYGFGMTKTFSDRLNMYAQATVRNIGRTGIICQGGLNWRL